MPKVISTQVELKDAYTDKLKSTMTIFLPKLGRTFQVPTVMLNVYNGRSSCLIRVESPEYLAQQLLKTIELIKSEIWFNHWERLQDVSNSISESGQPLVFDKKYWNPNQF